MIHFITNRENDYKHLSEIDDIRINSISEFFRWAENHKIFQLDVETLKIDDSANAIDDRKLVLLQIGSINGNIQWVFETDVLLENIKNFKFFMENSANSFIAHNARFEYIVIKRWLGITIDDIHDTFLMSKILNTGLELKKGYHSLSGCVERFFNIELDKTEQTGFTFDVLTVSQIRYGANDVVYLHNLFIKLKELLNSWDLWGLYNRVEREVLKVYGDMALNHMRFDADHWMNLNKKLKEEELEEEKLLSKFIIQDINLVNYLKSSSKILGMALIQPKDTLDINWASNITRKVILQKIVPELRDFNKFTKPELKKLAKANSLSGISNRILFLYLNRNFKLLNRYLKINYKDWLINEKLFIPRNTIKINWNSTIQRLYIFQFYYPNLENTNAKSLNRIYKNKLINTYKKYIKLRKYTTTYGEKFIGKYVKSNNTVSMYNVRQILNTGRIAGSILLQLPAQARFRNAFLPPYDDWVFVDSDYDSAELACMAYMAQEESLLQIIRDKKDAHMHVSQKLFPEEWEEAAEPNCTQLTTGKRCLCKTHNEMRNKGKAFNFGIPFGMTHIGLAMRLDIERSKAKNMLDDYYKNFPALETFFNSSEKFGIANNYIVGAAPTKRIRFFHSPANEGERMAIGREAKNFP